MPLQMVHLAVAREYVKAAANAADLMDCPEFYLGIISPDAIHVRPGTGKNDKRITHLYAEGDLWRANVVDFIKKNKAEANYAFHTWLWHSYLDGYYLARYVLHRVQAEI